MSEDLGDFLKEAARRRKERREQQESRPAPRPRATLAEAHGEAERTLVKGAEARESLADQARVGRAESLADSEAARYAARERTVERVAFAEQPSRPPAPTKRAASAPSATSSPAPGAFSQPQPVHPAESESDAEALFRLLSSPAGIRQAFLMSEILRPKHLDF